MESVSPGNSVVSDVWNWLHEEQSKGVAVTLEIKKDDRNTRTLELALNHHTFTIVYPTNYPTSFEEFLFIESESTDQDFKTLVADVSDYILEQHANLNIKAVLSKLAERLRGQRMSIHQETGVEEGGGSLGASSTDTLAAMDVDLKNTLDLKINERSIERGLWSTKWFTDVMPKYRTMKSTFVVPKENSSDLLANDLAVLQRDGPSKGIHVESIGGSIYRWRVILDKFRSESNLAVDLRTIVGRYGYDYIELELLFTEGLYPAYPPDIKVIRPRLDCSVIHSIAESHIFEPGRWRENYCSGSSFLGMVPILERVYTLLESAGKIDVNNTKNNPVKYPFGAYSELEQLLVSFTLTTGTKSRAVLPRYRSSHMETVFSPGNEAGAAEGTQMDVDLSAAAALVETEAAEYPYVDPERSTKDYNMQAAHQLEHIGDIRWQQYMSYIANCVRPLGEPPDPNCSLLGESNRIVDATSAFESLAESSVLPVLYDILLQATDNKCREQEAVGLAAMIIRGFSKWYDLVPLIMVPLGDDVLKGVNLQRLVSGLYRKVDTGEIRVEDEEFASLLMDVAVDATNAVLGEELESGTWCRVVDSDEEGEDENRQPSTAALLSFASKLLPRGDNTERDGAAAAAEQRATAAMMAFASESFFSAQEAEMGEPVAAAEDGEMGEHVAAAEEIASDAESLASAGSHARRENRMREWAGPGSLMNPNILSYVSSFSNILENMRVAIACKFFLLQWYKEHLEEEEELGLELEQKFELDQLWREEEAGMAYDMLAGILEASTSARIRQLMLDADEEGAAIDGFLEEMEVVLKGDLIRNNVKDYLWSVAAHERTDGGFMSATEVSMRREKFTPQPWVRRAMRRMLRTLNAEELRAGGVAASVVADRKKDTKKSSKDRVGKEGVLTGKKMNPKLAYDAVEEALVESYNLSKNKAARILEPLRTAAGTTTTTSVDPLRHIPDLAKKLLGPSVVFPTVSSTIGVRDFAAGMLCNSLLALLNHFPVSKTHLGGSMSPDFADTSYKTAPSFPHYNEADASTQFKCGERVCPSFHFLEGVLESTSLDDIFVGDIFGVAGHSRKGGLDPTNIRHMQLASEVLSSLLRGGKRVFRVYTRVGTIAAVSLFEELQEGEGKHFDIDVSVHGKTVRVHVFTNVLCGSDSLDSVEAVTVVLIGTEHVQLHRFLFLAGPMIAATSLSAGLAGKTLTTPHFNKMTKLCKTGSNMNYDDQWEGWQIFLAEEHPMNRALMLYLMLDHGYTPEEAMRCVLSRRTVGNGLKLNDRIKAQLAVMDLMFKPDKPENLLFVEEEGDVKAYSLSNVGGEETRLKRLTRDHAGYAAVRFTEQEGKSLTHSIQGSTDNPQTTGGKYKELGLTTNQTKQYAASLPRKGGNYTQDKLRDKAQRVVDKFLKKHSVSIGGPLRVYEEDSPVEGIEWILDEHTMDNKGTAIANLKRFDGEGSEHLKPIKFCELEKLLKPVGCRGKGKERAKAAAQEVCESNRE